MGQAVHLANTGLLMTKKIIKKKKKKGGHIIKNICLVSFQAKQLRQFTFGHSWV